MCEYVYYNVFYCTCVCVQMCYEQFIESVMHKLITHCVHTLQHNICIYTYYNYAYVYIFQCTEALCMLLHLYICMWFYPDQLHASAICMLLY